jgi:ribosomal protein S18 acetylase RimI-like enzyme
MAAGQTYSVWKRLFTLEPHNSEWQEFIIADDKDEILGSIKVLESPPGSKICWIDSINVNRKYRRKGWGSKLLEIAADNAKSKGCKRIQGQLIPNDGIQAQSLSDFYRKNGFVLTRQEDSFHPVIIKYLDR